jgi:signal transduction histidine kinase
MKQLEIRHRILLAALAPATLVAFLVSGILLAGQVEQAEVDQHRRLQAVARQVASSAEYNIFVGNTNGLQSQLEAVKQEADVVAAAILDRQGAVLASTVPVQDLPAADQIHEGFVPPASAEPLRHWHSIPIQASTLGEQDLFSLPTAETPLLGQLLLQVSNESLHHEMRRLILTAGATTALMLLFGILLAMALSRDLIRKLLRIRQVVDQVGHGICGERVAGIGADELGQLAHGINRMADRVEMTQADLAAQVGEATFALRKEKDEAEQAARARSRFFAAASHDLRQPAQALGLFVTRLERDARRSALLPRIRQLAQSVRTLQGLLDTLLDYSRLSGQVYRSDVQPVRASVVIAAIRAEFQATAAESNIELRQHVVDCWLMTDAAMLHRILLNLVSNALRHTRTGGVLLACRHNATHARLQVWDTGSGIPPGQQEAVFEELVQLDNPERDASKGLGLGLAIVRRTATLLNHPVTLHSRVGHGSCFTITIPLTHPPADLPDDWAAGAAANEILVCGKTDRALVELLELLESWGYTTRYAPAVTDAIDGITADGTPVLVIHETGNDLSAALDALDACDHAAGRALPGLLIHAGPLPAAELRGTQRLLLSRPYRPARLRALIDHLLNPAADSEDDDDAR